MISDYIRTVSKYWGWQAMLSFGFCLLVSTAHPHFNRLSEIFVNISLAADCLNRLCTLSNLQICLFCCSVFGCPLVSYSLPSVWAAWQVGQMEKKTPRSETRSVAMRENPFPVKASHWHYNWNWMENGHHGSRHIGLHLYVFVCVCVCLCMCDCGRHPVIYFVNACCHSGHELGGSYGFDRFWHPAREDFQAGLNKCLALPVDTSGKKCVSRHLGVISFALTTRTLLHLANVRVRAMLGRETTNTYKYSKRSACYWFQFNAFVRAMVSMCFNGSVISFAHSLGIAGNRRLWLIWWFSDLFYVILLWCVKHCQTSCAGHRTRIAAGYWRITNLQQGSCQTFVHVFRCALFQCLLQFDVTWCNRRKITTEFFKMLQAGGSGVSYCAKYLLDQTIFPCFLHKWFVQGLPNVS